MSYADTESKSSVKSELRTPKAPKKVATSGTVASTSIVSSLFEKKNI